MTALAPTPDQHVLTRADLAALAIPADEVVRWLRDGGLRELGSIALAAGEQPVFGVCDPDLEQDLRVRLATLGKTDVALDPNRARNALVQGTMAARGWVAPSEPEVEPAGEAEPLTAADAPLAEDGPVHVIEAEPREPEQRDLELAEAEFEALAQIYESAPTDDPPSAEDFGDDLIDADALLAALNGTEPDAADTACEPVETAPPASNDADGSDAAGSVEQEHPQEESLPEETMPAEANVADAPVPETPVQESPVPETPVAEAPVADSPIADAPASEVPVEESVIDTEVSSTDVETPGEEPLVEAAPAATTTVDEAPADAPAAAPAPEPVAVDEAAVDEAAVEEAAVVEATVESAVTEAAPPADPTPGVAEPTDALFGSAAGAPAFDAAAPAPAPPAEAAMAAMATMERVEGFLGELRGTLVEIAQRPAGDDKPGFDIEPLVAAVGEFGERVEHGVAVGVHAAMMSRDGAQQPSPAAPVPFERPASNGREIVMLSVAFLVLCWSGILWFKTGNATLAISTLVGANVIACCLLARRRD